MPIHTHARLRRTIGLSAGFAVCVLAVGGCGDRGPKLVPVEGKVALADGKPVHHGHVTFYPDTGKGNTSQELPIGHLQPDGTFAVKCGVRDGAPPGWYKVAVAGVEPTDQNDPYTTIWITHPRYESPTTSGFAVEVVDNPAPGRYDFKLDAAPPQKKRK